MARPAAAVLLSALTVALFTLLVIVLEAPKLSHPPALGRLEARNVVKRAGTTYLLGVGKADLTGPVVELEFMGYANLTQIGTGLRQRIYSRAFIIGNPDVPADRILYLVLDTATGDSAIRDGILRGLANMGPAYQMYTRHNVAVTGTHQHSGPAAWMNYLLPQITSKGFDHQSYQAIVDGALRSIQRAHENITTGRLDVSLGRISDANANRSPYAYLANPESERAQYEDDVDKAMTLVRFQRESDGKNMGILTWFAVHGTSMLGNNTIVTGDNKGVAASLLEQAMASDSMAAPGFVAGFSQSNVGDTTPNVLGAWCEDGSNQQCAFDTSTCGGTSQACHGRGPYYGRDDGGTDSCYEIGRRQYRGAVDILSHMSTEGTPITGDVTRSFHTYVDLSSLSFPHPSHGSIVRTCSAALGYSFAAGTSDGPGAFDFTQADNNTGDNPIWGVVGSFLHAPTADQRACQAPKPILLDVGASTIPYQWSPNIVDIQMMRVGQLLMIISPGEATTMSGRRWRNAIATEAKSLGLIGDSVEPVVVIGGPSNTYTHYITTEEEYGVQRYEGASTLYGPHTLNAYINLTVDRLDYLGQTRPNPPLALGPNPPININNSLSFIAPVVYDSSGSQSFGDVIHDVESLYTINTASTTPAPSVIANVTFVAANPRNNLHLEGTYVEVERVDDSGHTLATVRNDGDWDLWFQWRRTNDILGTSEVDVFWELGKKIGTPIQAGKYRMRYHGDAKSILGTITPFQGASATFAVQ
ncbi:uncharacterized protein Z518_08449 [Rhinocladiella mackenziei CBS 650.93]|uniref:Neutral ceramidase n=1 Tax=Rhinocladiella mackenziei CBS 650.93 TaxID=1442369 RepID=A0A0D2GWD2_9EURO|nr:uncharacterized protein Z518_08449 [Rhinocladiella mackenziei CBS 650.93]KIX02508.1 hypothetical protein Z518_08449 [Rhinocladiella mackenziei CBS 650.93]